MAERPVQPLFSIDPGWMYIIAGLLVIALATLIPARRDLHELRAQQADLVAKEQYAFDRLAAYAGFLDQWEHADDSLLIRLASSQLNRRPRGDRPVVLATNASSAVTEWIEASVDYESPQPVVWPDSILSRMTASQGQLWLLAAGALAVFVGLILTPAGFTTKASEDEDDEPATDDAAFAADSSRKLERGEIAVANTDTDADELAPSARDNDVDDDAALADLEAFGVDGNVQQTFWPEDDEADDAGDVNQDQDDSDNEATAYGVLIEQIDASALDVVDGQAAHQDNESTAQLSTGSGAVANGDTSIDDNVADDVERESAAGDVVDDEDEGVEAVDISRAGGGHNGEVADDDEDEDEDEWEEGDDEEWEDGDEEWEDDEDGEWEDDEDEPDDEEEEPEADEDVVDEEDDDEYEDEDEEWEDEDDDEYEDEDGEDEDEEEGDEEDDDLFVDDEDDDEPWEEDEESEEK